MEEKKVGEKLNEAVDAVKDELEKDVAEMKEEVHLEFEDKTDVLAEKLKASEAAAKEAVNDVKTKVLGEDGKFDKADVDRIVGDVKEKASEVGEKAKNAILGDDGKFDKEDVDRIASDVKDAAKGVIDKVKGLFEDK